jgi:CRP/FNR family transcriptional regulator, cyclic AMP receptor protein
MITTAKQVVARTRAEWSSRSFLAQLAQAELDAVVEAGRLRRFGSGELMVEEGGLDSNVYLLLTPCAKVTAALPGAGEALLAVRVAGDVVGELAALDGGPRLATVRACSQGPLYTLMLTAGSFSELLDRNPRAARWLSGSMAAKLRSATRRRIDYSGFPPHVRLARVLVEMAEDHGYQPRGKDLVVGVNLTQVELGTLVGVAEVTAQRGLRRLRREGLVVTDERRPIIRDLAGLRKTAGLP